MKHIIKKILKEQETTKYLDKVSSILEKPYFKNMVEHYGITNINEQEYILKKILNINKIKIIIDSDSYLRKHDYQIYVFNNLLPVYKENDYLNEENWCYIEYINNKISFKETYKNGIISYT
jgi:hypothetical protein